MHHGINYWNSVFVSLLSNFSCQSFSLSRVCAEAGFCSIKNIPVNYFLSLLFDLFYLLSTSASSPHTRSHFLSAWLLSELWPFQRWPHTKPQVQEVQERSVSREALFFTSILFSFQASLGIFPSSIITSLSLLIWLACSCESAESSSLNKVVELRWYFL